MKTIIYLISDNDIWHRAGTYGQPESRGTRWLQVSGLKVKNIAIGVDVVVGTTPNDDIYIREGNFIDFFMGSDCFDVCIFLKLLLT